MTTNAMTKKTRESQENKINPKGMENAGTKGSPQEEIEQDGIPACASCAGRIETSAKTPGDPCTGIARVYRWMFGEQFFRPGAVIAEKSGRMTSSPIRRISREAVEYLNRRGYEVRYFTTLYGRGAPEMFDCKNSRGDTFCVKLKISPNTLTTVEEVARYCEDEILEFRREMKTYPRKPGEHYEVLVTTLGEHFAVEVKPDTLIDKRPRGSSGTGNLRKYTVKASRPATRLPKKIQCIRKQPDEITGVPS